MKVVICIVIALVVFVYVATIPMRHQGDRVLNVCMEQLNNTQVYIAQDERKDICSCIRSKAIENINPIIAIMAYKYEKAGYINDLPSGVSDQEIAICALQTLGNERGGVFVKPSMFLNDQEKLDLTFVIDGICDDKETMLQVNLSENVCKCYKNSWYGYIRDDDPNQWVHHAIPCYNKYGASCILHTSEGRKNLANLAETINKRRNEFMHRRGAFNADSAKQSEWKSNNLENIEKPESVESNVDSDMEYSSEYQNMQDITHKEAI